MKNMTKKQAELLKSMYDVLWTEMDWGTIGKKKVYTVKEASKLISLNVDMFYLIMDEGQCTIRQYAILTKIAGRKPHQERWTIGRMQAIEWINAYSNRIIAQKTA